MKWELAYHREMRQHDKRYEIILENGQAFVLDYDSDHDGHWFFRDGDWERIDQTRFDALLANPDEELMAHIL